MNEAGTNSTDSTTRESSHPDSSQQTSRVSILVSLIFVALASGLVLLIVLPVLTSKMQVRRFKDIAVIGKAESVVLAELKAARFREYSLLSSPSGVFFEVAGTCLWPYDMISRIVCKWDYEAGTTIYNLVHGVAYIEVNTSGTVTDSGAYIGSRY